MPAIFNNAAWGPITGPFTCNPLSAVPSVLLIWEILGLKADLLLQTKQTGWPSLHRSVNRIILTALEVQFYRGEVSN